MYSCRALEFNAAFQMPDMLKSKQAYTVIGTKITILFTIS